MEQIAQASSGRTVSGNDLNIRIPQCCKRTVQLVDPCEFSIADILRPAAARSLEAKAWKLGIDARGLAFLDRVSGEKGGSSTYPVLSFPDCLSAEPFGGCRVDGTEAVFEKAGSYLCLRRGDGPRHFVSCLHSQIPEKDSKGRVITAEAGNAGPVLALGMPVDVLVLGFVDRGFTGRRDPLEPAVNRHFTVAAESVRVMEDRTLLSVPGLSGAFTLDIPTDWTGRIVVPFGYVGWGASGPYTKASEEGDDYVWEVIGGTELKPLEREGFSRRRYRETTDEDNLNAWYAFYSYHGMYLMDSSERDFDLKMRVSRVVYENYRD